MRCKWLKQWIKKCDDDSETSNWIAANTKVFLLSEAVNEKNGGGFLDVFLHKCIAEYYRKSEEFIFVLQRAEQRSVCCCVCILLNMIIKIYPYSAA